MIKILPTGTTFTFTTGRKPVRNITVNGRLGEGAGKHVFETPQMSLDARWSSSAMEAVLEAREEVYISRITAQFQFRSPRSPRDTALWCEDAALTPEKGFGKNLPGTLSVKTARQGAGSMWISESADAEGLFLFQKPPALFPLRFSCSPRARKLTVEWVMERVVLAGEKLSLPVVHQSRCGWQTAVDDWRRKWRKSSQRPPSPDRRKAWWDSGEASSPRTLRDTLSLLRGAGLSLDWFALSPGYASHSGDWLVPTEAFRDRMGSASRSIGEYNMIPGLRFAPFLVSRRSAIASKKREWLLKDSGGSPVAAGAYGSSREPSWVLDITRSDVQKHILHTLSVMRSQWGFRAFVLERLGDAALPGLRHDETLGQGELCDLAARLLREGAGNKVFLAGSGIPFQFSAGLWDARFVCSAETASGLSHRDAAALLLNAASWNGGAWVNAAGPLPLSLFSPDSPPAAGSFYTAAALAAKAVFFTASLKELENFSGGALGGGAAHSGTVNGGALRSFLSLFDECREKSLEVERNVGGGTQTPLVACSSSGHLGLFNFSSKKNSVVLRRDALKSAFASGGKIAPGESTVLNSPEIHVVLPPGGHRIFRG